MACIYVAYGREGLVKVGRTSNFKRRIASLKKEFGRFGNVILSAQAFDELSDRKAAIAEYRLIFKLQGALEQYYGREWFVGDPMVACQAAAITSHEVFFSRPERPRPTPEQLEKWRKARVEMLEKIAKERAEYSAARRKQIEDRRTLRETRRREVAEREAMRHGLLKATESISA